MIKRKEDNNKKIMFRQGDVMLIKVDSRPATATIGDKDNGRIILAYGEVTGHAHAISVTEAEIWVEAGRRWLEVCYDKAHLNHEEHSTIVIPPGTYEVIQQREYSVLTQMSRQVID